jgi:hypothetical protein
LYLSPHQTLGRHITGALDHCFERDIATNIPETTITVTMTNAPTRGEAPVMPRIKVNTLGNIDISTLSIGSHEGIVVRVTPPKQPIDNMSLASHDIVLVIDVS